MAKRSYNTDVEIDLPMPLLGLDETRSYTRQRAGTTAMVQNARAFEPSTDRARMGQRPGLTKFCTSTVVGDYPVQEIAYLATNDVANPSLAIGESMYALTSGNGFGLASNAGVSQWTAGAVASFAFSCSCWDDSGNVYVTTTNTATGATKIYKYTSAGVLATNFPVTTITVTTGSLRAVCGMVVIGSYLYFACTQGGLSRIHKIETTTGAVTSNWLTTTGITTMVFSTSAVNCLGKIGVLLGVECLASGTSQCFKIVNTVTGARISTAYGGTGQSNRSTVCSDGTSFFYVIASVTAGIVKKITKGGVIEWSSTAADTPQGLCYDFTNAFLVAVLPTTPSMRRLSLAAGTLVSSGDPGAITTWQWIDSASDGTFTLWDDASGANDTMGTNITYSTVWGPTTRANTTHAGASMNKGPTLQAGFGSNRQIRCLAVSNGTAVRFSSTGPQSITSGAVFSPDSPSVYAVQAGLDLYFVDGTTYYYYKSTTNAMTAWTASAGTMPAGPRTGRARLITYWNNRIVFAGFPDEPSSWYMSAKNAPRDWDYARTITSPDQAVNGSNPIGGSPGNAQDVTNCLIRYNDDTLILGGDHTIQLFAGDPMEGGSLTIVAPIGIAFGRPFAVDSMHQVYFMSTNGNIYKFTPGAKPVMISQQIKRRLENIDLSAVVVSMTWVERWEGLAVWITPYDSTQQGTNFFYEARTNAWFPDYFAEKKHCPQSVYSFDGDRPADQMIMLGCRDGYVRLFTDDATDDDGTEIESYVLIGPIKTPSLDSILFKDPLAILGADSGDVRYDVYSGRSPEEAFGKAGTPSKVFGTWTAGRNTVAAVRRDGRAHFVKISATSPWSIEKIMAWYQVQGLVMKRGG